MRMCEHKTAEVMKTWKKLQYEELIAVVKKEWRDRFLRNVGDHIEFYTSS
jgi:hypothetical protein